MIESFAHANASMIHMVHSMVTSNELSSPEEVAKNIIGNNNSISIIILTSTLSILEDMDGIHIFHVNLAPLHF